MPMDTSTLKSHISSRLKTLRDRHYDRSGSQMAEAVDKSQSSVNRVLNERPKGIDPYLTLAARVADDLGMDVEEITEPGDASSQESSEPDMSRILMYDEVKAGAGNGKKPLAEWSYEEVGLPRHILRKLTGSSTIPKKVGVVEVQGESMYPEIQNGDLVMFTPADTIADGGTYLIRMDDALLVKVLQRKPGHRIRIHSLNSEFSDDVIRQTDTGRWVTDDEQEHHVSFDVVGSFLNVIQQKDLYRSSQRVHDLMRAYRSLDENSLSG